MNKKIFKGMSLAAISAVIATTMSTPVFAAVDAIIVKDNKTGNLTEYSLKEIKKSQIEKMMGGEGKLYKSYLNKLNDGKVYSYHDDEINDYVDAAKANKAYRDGLVSGNHIKIDDYTKTASAEAIIVPEGTMVKETIGENGEIVENPIEKPVEKTEIKEVSAINGTVTVTFNKELKEVPAEIKVFKDGEALEVKAEDMKLVEGKLVIIVPVIEATEEEQSVVYGVQLGENEIKNAEEVKVDAKDLTAPTVKVGTVENYQTLKVEFSEKVVGTPEVKVNGQDAKAILAEDGLSLTIKNEVGYAAGTYNITINGLTDEAKNEMAKDTVVAIVKEASYIKDINFITTGLANTSGQKVYFKSIDQYGQEVKTENINKLNVVGKMNNFPLDVTHNEKQNYVVINDKLVEGKTVEITITNINKDNNTLATSTFLKVVEKVELKPTAIKNIKVDKTTCEAGTNNISLTANVVDQFGNPISLEGNKIRWTTSDKSVISFQDNEATKDLDESQKSFIDGEINIKVDAKSKGSANIQAFLSDGTEVSTPLVLTVTDKELKDLTITQESNELTNKDEKIVGTIKQNAGAVLTADMINFDVKATKTDVDATAEDIEVSAKLRSEVDKNATDDNKNDIVLVAKTSKVGKFDITAYVGESLEKVNAKSNTISLTSTIDQNVAKVDDITFDAKELKVGQDIKKDVVFRNKHDEVVVVENTNAVVTPDVVTKSINKVENEDGTFKNELTLKVGNAGKYQVTINNGKALKSYTLKFEVPELTTINAGKDITGVVAGDTVDKAKYQEIKFLDQDGVDIATKFKDIKVLVKDSEGKEITGDNTELVTLLKSYKVEDGKVTEEDAKTDDSVVAYKVCPGSALEQGNYTVEISCGDVKDSFNVTVGEARKLKELNVTTTTNTVGQNGLSTIKVTPVDQYGNFKEFKINDSNIEISDTNVLETVKDNKEQFIVKSIDKDGKETSKVEDTVAYTFQVKGLKSGLADVKVKDTTEDSKIEGKVSIEVVPAASVVKSIEFVNDNIDKDGNYKYKLQKDNIKAAEFGIKALDEKGNGIAINDKDITWVSSDKSIATVEAGVVKTADIKDDKDKTVTITASVGKVEKSITLIVSKDEETLVQDSVKITAAGDVTDLSKVDADATKEGIQISLDGDTVDGENNENGTITLTLNGINQFGNECTTTTVTSVKPFNEEIILANNLKNTVTITPKSVGSSTLEILVGTKKIYVDVNVTEKNAGIIKAEEAKKLEEAKTALAGEIKAIENGYVKVSVDGNDIATAEKWTTEAAKTALENEVKAAKAVVENKDATTKEVEDATAKLKLAVKTYTDAQQDGTKAE